MFTEKEYRAAKRAATSVARVNKGYLDDGDVLGAIYEWMVKNQSKVETWREEELGGVLNTALYRAGLRYAHNERKRITGAHDEDLYYYSPAVVEELLPLIWDYEDWYMDASSDRVKGRGGDPALGNTRLATLVDVASATYALRSEDLAFIRQHYQEGVPFDLLGPLWEMTEDGARKRHARIVRRIVRNLGGEPPWFDGPGTRKARSNASAQVETRDQA